MAATTAPPANASNVDIARWVIDVLNSHDVTPLRERGWADGVVERFPDRTCRGKDELAAYFGGAVRSAARHADGGRGGVRRGRERVPALADDRDAHRRAVRRASSRPASAIELDGMDHFVIRDGLVVSNFVVFDQMDVGRALGLLPPDGSQADRALKAAFNAKTKIAEAIRQARS